MGRCKNALIALLLASAASAEEPQAASDGWQDELVSRCKRQVRHVPRADVEYKPGTAAGGWAVKSPNLNEPLTVDTSKIEIPLQLPAANYVADKSKYNVDFSELRLNVGTLAMKDGKLTLDGQPLEEDDPRMADLCDSVQNN